MTRHTIGSWTFCPADNELRRGEQVRRLEDRAARTLELLCAHRGETISAETIVGHVWNGRQLSPNSVAVVISQLRAALGDSARSPTYIETVAKRGYRLSANGNAPRDEAPPAPPRRRLWLWGLLLFAALIGLAILSARGRAAEPVILYTPVANETGSTGYDPLARATNELLLNQLKQADLRVADRDGAAARSGRRIALSAKLTLWTGNPTVNLSASDVATGEVIWRKMVKSPPSNFPDGVRDGVRSLVSQLRSAEKD